MRKELQHIIAGLLAAAAVLVAVDVVYRLTLYDKDMAENCDLMEKVQRAVGEQAEVIYLGESSDFSTADADSDRRSICRMVADELGESHMSDMASAATHAGVFYDMMNRLPQKNNIHSAVVTVNMRSFTAEWIYSNLEIPLRKQQLMLKRRPALWNKAMLVFKAYPRWSEEERQQKVIQHLQLQPAPQPYGNAAKWDNAMADSLGAAGWPQDSLAMACHYIKCFSTVVDDDNPRIKDLDRIVRLCQRRGWHLVMHILPDNEEQMQRMVGRHLVQMLRDNGRYVQERYERMGVTVVNNQGLVPDSAYTERNYPTEHYSQEGRMAVAKAIAQKMKNEK